MRVPSGKAIFWFADKANTVVVEKMLRTEYGATPIQVASLPTWMDLTRTALSILSCEQAVRNQMLVGFLYGEVSFGALTVIISISSVIDLTCTIQQLATHDPLTGDFRQFFSPMIKVHSAP